MRMYRRAERVQVRVGNVLPDVSGEICTPPVLAAGTGTFEVIEAPRLAHTIRRDRRAGALGPHELGLVRPRRDRLG